jgi:uncharacterized membrane protein YeaQ/YmgE (transglycosylase-associated protein family)
MTIEVRAIVIGAIIGAAAGLLMGRAAKGGGIATMLQRRGVVR